MLRRDSRGFHIVAHLLKTEDFFYHANLPAGRQGHKDLLSSINNTKNVILLKTETETETECCY